MDIITNYKIPKYVFVDFIWLILLTFMTFMVIRIIVGVIKSERNRKAFAPTMKPGDKVCAPILNDRVDGEVLEVNDDEVVIKITVPKSRVYPQKDKLSNTDKLIGAFKNRKY